MYSRTDLCGGCRATGIPTATQVRYRQASICEIDLQTDRMTSFLQPVKKANRLEEATPGCGRLSKPSKRS